MALHENYSYYPLSDGIVGWYYFR